MYEPNSSLSRLKAIEGDLDNDTLLLASHNGKTRKVDLAKLKTFVGSGSSNPGSGNGSPGQGFVFGDLTPHLEEIVVFSELEYFNINSQVTLTGDLRTGSLTTEVVSDGYGILIWFKTAKETSYKMCLNPNSQLQIIVTKTKLDLTGEDSGQNPIEAAGGEVLANLLIGEGEISFNIKGQDTGFQFTQQDEDWLEIVQNGIELIWFINDEEVFRTPQDPDTTYFNIIITEFDSVFEFKYDLSETVAEYERGLNLSNIEDMVIYQSDHDLRILDRYIAKGDYIQFLENKSKVFIYPQLSRLYDFDTIDPVNLIIEDFSISALASNIQVIPSTEEGKGQITFANQVNVWENFSQATPETLEWFTVEEDSSFIRLLQTQDASFEDNQIQAEFILDKENIYTSSSIRGSVGNAKLETYWFFAGADRDKNYLRYSFNTYDNEIGWFVCGADGIEVRFNSISSRFSDVRISLKNGAIRIRETPSNLTFLNQIGLENESDFQKLLDFTDNSDGIFVRARYENDEPDNPSTEFVNNVIIAIDKFTNYVNLTPLEIKLGSGEFKVKLPKDKNFGFYFLNFNSQNALCNSTMSGEFPYLGIMGTWMNATTCQLVLFETGGRSSTYTETIEENQNLTLQLIRGDLNTFITIAGHQISANFTAKNIYMVDIRTVWGKGNHETLTIGYEAQNATGPVSIDFDLIQNRDKLRLKGKSIVLNGEQINPGDIVEFFNDKKEMLITRGNTDTEDDPTQNIIAVVDRIGDPIDNVKAWYDEVRKRIVISGNIYYSGAEDDGNKLFELRIPEALRGQINNISNYIGVILTYSLQDNNILYSDLSIDGNGNGQYNINVKRKNSNWTAGYIIIPDQPFCTML